MPFFASVEKATLCLGAASYLALQLFGPMPNAARGASLSILSLVDQGMLRMPRDQNASLYNSVGFCCIKSLVSFINVRWYSNIFYTGVVPYSFLYNATTFGILALCNVAAY